LSREARILALVSVASSVSSLDLSLMFVAYPSIRRDFGNVPLTEVSWVLTSYTIVAAALLIPAGRVADRIGRRKVFLTSLVLFATGSALCAIAPAVPLLIAARVLQAIGGSMLTPSALAIVMGTMPASRRSWAIGVWSTVTGVVATAAPTIGALLVEYASWRWAFVINVPIGIGCFFVGRRVLDEAVDPEAGPLPDALGVVLVAASISMLAFGIVQSSAWGWNDRGTIVALSASATLLSLFVWRCAHHPAPVIDLRVFRPVLFRANALTAIAIGTTFWGGYYVFIQFLTLGWGYTLVTTGLLLIPMTVAASIAAIPAGRLMDRYGHRVVMVPGALLFSAALLWLALRADDNRAVLAVWMPAALAIGITNAVCFPGVNSAGARTAPPETLAVTAGIVQTLIRIGGTTGAALGIALVGDLRQGVAASEFRPAFIALAATGLVAAVAALPLATRDASPAAARALSLPRVAAATQQAGAFDRDQ
jgi:EmrB/QacA subfamily drug resistance transporter